MYMCTLMYVETPFWGVLNLFCRFLAKPLQIKFKRLKNAPRCTLTYTCTLKNAQKGLQVWYIRNFECICVCYVHNIRDCQNYLLWMRNQVYIDVHRETRCTSMYIDV